MTNPPAYMAREDLLARGDATWGRYVAALNSLTPADQSAYARAHGFDNLTALLAHLYERFAQALTAVQSLADGRPADVPDNRTARTATPSTAQTLAQVEQDFDRIWTNFSGVVGELPLDVFEQPQVYNWVHSTLITLYDAHEPPGEAQTPAEQHDPMRPDAGENVP